MKTLLHWLACRARKEPCTTVVLHGTAGASASSSVDWLRKIGLSYHYLIDRDGSIIKAVPYSKVAYHAGVSMGPQGKDVNRYSVGIAFANLENGRDPITGPQYAAVVSLIRQLERELPIRYLTTHYAIAPKRKSDPVMLRPTKLREMADQLNLKPYLS